MITNRSVRGGAFRLRLLAAVAVVAATAGVAADSYAAAQRRAPPRAAASASPPDIGGFWELMDDSKKVTPADTTPAAKEAARKAREASEAGQIVGFASRWCHPLGTPFIMGDSAPLDIIQSKREIAITAEVQSAARHIYMDGRKHPDPDSFDNTTNGHSIGRWEGDTLVVDTVGFNERGNTFIPGGGNRGPNSHLVERYRLINGGKNLSVTFTWNDPTQFNKPHTYEFVYYKAPPETYALEYFCDASDPSRGGSVVPPKQD